MVFCQIFNQFYEYVTFEPMKGMEWMIFKEKEGQIFNQFYKYVTFEPMKGPEWIIFKEKECFVKEIY